MFNSTAGIERPIHITPSDLDEWSWLCGQVEERDGAYYPTRLRGDHGDPGFELPIAARRLGVEVRELDGSLHIDLAELRSKVDEHHWLRHAEGFNWCPACGCDLSTVGVLPPSYSLLA